MCTGFPLSRKGRTGCSSSLEVKTFPTTSSHRTTALYFDLFRDKKKDFYLQKTTMVVPWYIDVK